MDAVGHFRCISRMLPRDTIPREAWDCGFRAQEAPAASHLRSVSCPASDGMTHTAPLGGHATSSALSPRWRARGSRHGASPPLGARRCV